LLVFLSNVKEFNGLKKLSVAIVIILLITTALMTSFSTLHPAVDQKNILDQVYIGVAFCGNTSAEAKLLIERVKDYTNLFILQSGPISTNETAINEICNYAVDSGLNLIVYFGDLNPKILSLKHLEWRATWASSAKTRWGDKFLGIYYYDEPGGLWLDTDWTAYPSRVFSNSTYDTTAQKYIESLQNEKNVTILKTSSIPTFVSDYALYWFDYQGGYDVVFGQIGWNHSLAQDITLLRGAANIQNKDWGAMITWKYTQPPYLDSGKEIYNQMVTAYEAGAKYITVFNYPQLSDNPYGVMRNEHFDALRQFWNDAINHKISHNSITADTALVLPNNYGWGMRNPTDRIWGYWGPDEKSPIIWQQSRRLLAQYGLSLDIVYDDPNFSVAEKYTQIYWWNSSSPIIG
jgi:hypothetical protein